MRQYTFNASLFRILSQLLDVTKRDIANVAGVFPSAINYWGKREDVPLAGLVTICNHFHIPISYFICPEDEATIAIGIGQFIRSDFSLNSLSIDTLHSRILSLSPNLSIRQFARLLDINPQTVINYWQNSEHIKMTVRFFVNIVNASRIYPGEFLASPSRPITLLEGYAPLSAYNPYDILQDTPRQDSSVRKENEILARKVKNLEERIRELEEIMEYRTGRVAEEETL